jgi:esterase/lipase superfamily enzyme
MKQSLKTGIALPVLLIIFAASCASTKPYTQDLMETPEVFEEGTLDPFNGYEGWSNDESLGILYATNRIPAPDDAEVPYLNERDVLLHLGMADIDIGGTDVDWGSVQDIALLKNSDETYPLSLKGITSFGPLDDALHAFVDPARIPADRNEPSRKFAAIVNERLADNPVKDIFIYVHGVNTSFEAPLLVASELWHFMGYRGAFIAFSWPSGQSLLKYFSDVDTAEYSATLFRKFLEYLGENTDAERIHILAYSAGTKLASQALYQIGLMEQGLDPEQTKIGRVLFVAGDVERQLFGLYASDGLLDPIDTMTVYVSDSDKALDSSETLRIYPRLGQYWGDEGPDQEVMDFIRSSGKLDFVNVSGLEGTKENSGHSYFRTSPWVSSDILTNLGLGMRPGNRGLVRRDNQINWSFPDDYIDRLRLALEQRVFERNLEQNLTP